MKLGLYSLYWDNIDPAVVAGQKRVCDHLQLPIQQHRIHGLDHGEWIDWVLERNHQTDVVIFLDVDCIPLNAGVFVRRARWADQFQGLCGAKACASHLDKNKEYAGPWYLFVSRERWNAIDRCSARATAECDVAQNLTDAWLFNQGRLAFVLPSACEIPLWGFPDELAMKYGIGTTYGEDCYHLFEARTGEHTELFLKACERVLSGETS